MRSGTSFAVAAAFVVTTSPLLGQNAKTVRIAVTSAPALTITHSAQNADFSGQVVGAVRAPNGTTIVAQRGGQSALLAYGPTGSLLPQRVRNGDGPGEVGAVEQLLSCGGKVYVFSQAGTRVDIFTQDLRYVRRIRFTRQSQKSACDDLGNFVHMGWEDFAQFREGTYRPKVRFWTTRQDSLPGTDLGTFPGAEKFGLVVNGKPSGAMPQLLGRVPQLAIAGGTVAMAFGDSLSLARFTIDGRALAPIVLERSAKPATARDMEAAIEAELQQLPEGDREQSRAMLAKIRRPATLPATRTLLRNDAGRFWIQESFNSDDAHATWYVVDSRGAVLQQFRLPSNMEPLHIAAGWLLSRFTDADGDVQIHGYRVSVR
jgi:hypothetical protein